MVALRHLAGESCATPARRCAMAGSSETVARALDVIFCTAILYRLGRISEDPMLTRKAKYALHALSYLARHQGDGPVLIADLSEAEQIPKKFLERILLDLNRRGMLQSRKGRGGGYLLNRAPEQITIAEVVRAIDGPLAPVPCVSRMAYARCTDCRDERHCGIRAIMHEVRDAIAAVLDQATLADLVRAERTGSYRHRP